MFGPDVRSLKGKTVWCGTDHVSIVDLVDIPATIMIHYRYIILAGDIMLINKIPFFMTISRYLRFGTAEMMRMQQNILAAICQVKGVYIKRGFRITHFFMDGQFDSLHGEMAAMLINLNTVSNDKHAPEIE
eukprot:scaffold37028_cov57-Attheya_sp.AAC.5